MENLFTALVLISGTNYVVSGTLGAAAVHACYYHKQNESIQVK